MKTLMLAVWTCAFLALFGCELHPFPIDGPGAGGSEVTSSTADRGCDDCELGVLCCDEDSCATCAPPGECQIGYCLDGQCVYLTADDGLPCGNRGICTAGKCTDEACEPAACDPPADLCGTVSCNEKEQCVYGARPVGVPCGFAGTCNADGKCEGLLKPLECPSGCPNDTECSVSECNPYTGLCKPHHHGNGTACESGAGHCNAKTGTCCKGTQAAKCNTITDPVACFGACANNTDECTFECVDECPLGTSDIKPPKPPQYFCFPEVTP